MYEKFTDRARQVMQFANQEAQRFKHEYIGTEHILLGLVKEGSGVAANVLKNLDIDLHKVRGEVEKIVQSGPDTVTADRLPLTPRAKKVIEYSIEEAHDLNHNYVGTEHLLLGLLREEEGVAAQVLMNLGLKVEDLRNEVLELLGYPKTAVPSPTRRSWWPTKEYDVFVPLQYSDGTPIESATIASVTQRLHDQFGGVLRFWCGDKDTLRSEILVLRVVTEEGPAVRAFFEGLLEELKGELRQEKLLIVVRNVENL